MRRLFVFTRFALALHPAGFCQALQALMLSGNSPLTQAPFLARDGSTYYVFATALLPDEGNPGLAWSVAAPPIAEWASHVE